MFLFLFVYALYWLWPRRRQWRPTARTCGLLAAMGLAMGTWVLVPSFVESGYVKLFYGDPLAGWQKTYSFKSLLGLVDRNGSATRSLIGAVMSRIQANGGRVSSQSEYDQVQRLMSLGTDSPEKYMGIVLLAILAATVLWNTRRAERRAFWFFVAALLASVMLATGPSSVWTANWTTWMALSSQQVSGVAFGVAVRRRGVFGAVLPAKANHGTQVGDCRRGAGDFPVCAGIPIVGHAPVFQGNPRAICLLRYTCRISGADAGGFLCHGCARGGEMAGARAENCGGPGRAVVGRLLAVSEADVGQWRPRSHAGEPPVDVPIAREGPGLGQDLLGFRAILSPARADVGRQTAGLRSLLQLDVSAGHGTVESRGDHPVAGSPYRHESGVPRPDGGALCRFRYGQPRRSPAADGPRRSVP